MLYILIVAVLLWLLVCWFWYRCVRSDIRKFELDFWDIVWHYVQWIGVCCYAFLVIALGSILAGLFFGFIVKGGS